MTFEKDKVRFCRADDTIVGHTCYYALSYWRLQQAVQYDIADNRGTLIDVDDAQANPFRISGTTRYPFVYMANELRYAEEFDGDRVIGCPGNRTNEILDKELPIYAANTLADLLEIVLDPKTPPGRLAGVKQTIACSCPFMFQQRSEEPGEYRYIYVSQRGDNDEQNV